MGINEIREKRNQLALEITKLIQQFEKETNVQITDVDLTRLQFVMGKSKLSHVQLRAELDG